MTLGHYQQLAAQCVNKIKLSKCNCFVSGTYSLGNWGLLGTAQIPAPTGTEPGFLHHLGSERDRNVRKHTKRTNLSSKTQSSFAQFTIHWKQSHGGALAKELQHLLCTQKVSGSIPTISNQRHSRDQCWEWPCSAWNFNKPLPLELGNTELAGSMLWLDTSRFYMDRWSIAQ